RDEPDQFDHVRGALTPQDPDVVGGGRRSATGDGHDDPEADDDLGRGDDQDEEHDDLAGDVVEHAPGGDEREVHGLEHQLDAHEHDERVGAAQEADRAQHEEHGAEHEVADRQRAAVHAAPSVSGSTASTSS